MGAPIFMKFLRGLSLRFQCEDGEGVADLELVTRVSAEEFVDGAGGTRQLGIIIIMDDDNSLRGESGDDEL